jgi:hypothetical protein
MTLAPRAHVALVRRATSVVLSRQGLPSKIRSG